MADCLLGADYGTGGAKLALIDSSGEQLGYAYEEYPIYTDQPGWSEHDAPRYWDAFCRMTRKILADTGVDPAHIRGVAASSALPSVVLVDRDGEPLPRAYNLMDRRATNEVAWVSEHIGAKRIFDITANRLEDHPVLMNVLWERNNHPERYKTIAKVLTIDGFINFKLTGASTAHYSAAPFYGVYDILDGHFDTDLLEAMDVDPALMPDLCRCEDIIGEITSAAAAECGLAPGTPVAGGQVDCNAGWMQGGAIEPGDIQMNLGTAGNFGIIHRSREFLFSESGAASINFPYTVDSADTYVTVPTTTTGGGTLRYLRDQFSALEIERERAGGPDVYDVLNEQAAAVPPGAEGLLFLPYLMGERTPIWDVNARGVLFGLSLNHTKGHVVRAAMEGVAFALYHSFETLSEAGLTINYPLVLNEGGAKSVLWRRIITDVFDVGTVLLERRTGAPYGDAILAGVATGVFKDFDVARQWATTIDPMEPDAAAHADYMERFALFKQVYQDLKGDFVELARIRSR
ncbi:MAG: FGGY-family carbohydrate kinase [Chloroflexota bacterium]|nr:FGGY-family carbohydrate kinase [Chloroflexota bacterium]